MIKSLKIALAAAALASMPAFAAAPSAPFELTEFNRTLPTLAQPAGADRAAVAGSTRDASAPYEMTEFDRTLPNVAVNPAQASGGAGPARSVWGKDRVPDPYNP